MIGYILVIAWVVAELLNWFLYNKDNKKRVNITGQQILTTQNKHSLNKEYISRTKRQYINYN